MVASFKRIPGAMGEIGSFLREGREKAGLCQEELARTIRVSVSTVQAIEEERWQNLPAPVFVKGFVSSWCRAVGVDEDRAREALARALDVHAASGPHLPKPPVGTGIVVGRRNSFLAARYRRKMVIGAFLLILAGLAVFLSGVAGGLMPGPSDEQRPAGAPDVVQPASSGLTLPPDRAGDAGFPEAGYRDAAEPGRD